MTDHDDPLLSLRVHAGRTDLRDGPDLTSIRSWTFETVLPPPLLGVLERGVGVDSGCAPFAQAEVDAFIGEIESTGTAFESMRERNQALLNQLTQRDEANASLTSERLRVTTREPYHVTQCNPDSAVRNLLRLVTRTLVGLQRCQHCVRWQLLRHVCGGCDRSLSGMQHCRPCSEVDAPPQQLQRASCQCILSRSRRIRAGATAGASAGGRA